MITKAQEAAFKTEIGKVDEQFRLYLNEKTLQNMKFERGTLNVGETSIFYNTKEETEQGNIYTVLKGIKQDFAKDFEVIKGEMYYFTQDKRKLKWALEMGMKTNPYEIVDGVLISSEKNLSLMDEATGSITIPERVIAVGEGTFTKLEGIKKIIIPPTCKEIKDNAFYGNTTLEEVIILADGNKGLERIGNFAFRDCTKLKIIQMPNTVKEIGMSTFINCSSLTDVQLSNNLKTISFRAFGDCLSLKEITIPEGVQEMGGFVFQSCNLTKISFPKSLETIDQNCFWGLKLGNLQIKEDNEHFIYENGMLLSKDRTKIFTITEQSIKGNSFTIPNGIEKLAGGVLEAYAQITKVIIPESVKELEANFFPTMVETIEIDEKNAQYISINKQICSKDKKILYFCYSKDRIITLEEGIETLQAKAVFNCSNAVTINLPTTLKRLEAQSLQGMINVKTIKLGKNVQYIEGGHAFDYNDTLQSIEIDPENPYFMAENGTIYTKDKTQLVAFINNTVTQFTIPEGIEVIQVSAFSGRKQLTNIVLPTTLKEIKYYSFARCHGLTKIEIPNSIESIEWAVFEDCSNLSQIIIDKPKGSISGSPWGCVYGDRAIKWLR